MTAETLLREVQSMGVDLCPDGDLLRVRGPKGTLTDGLIEELRRYKWELLRLLCDLWPPECLESERRFGHPAARLYPLLGRQVTTPRGRGELVAVLGGAVVVFDDGKARCFLIEEVTP